MKDKKRLDILLAGRGLCESREKARATIMSGIVYVNGQKEDKPGAAFEDTQSLVIEVRGNALPYVSRGGLKLGKAILAFGIDLKGKTCMDIGASTGGFTDCMLQNGAAKVYAVDVGHGQLAWKLRCDERVVNMEKTNVRYLVPEDIGNETIEFASVDVSFIGLEKILPAARQVLGKGASMVCLIKPQFEANREDIGKKGVVRDPKVHIRVIRNTMEAVQKLGFQIKGLTYSPIRGPEGNIEYLIYLEKSDQESIVPFASDVEGLVAESHRVLEEK